VTKQPGNLPPCGLYRTTKPIGDVGADRLVYFHNHGNPGAGLYFPERWTGNRAHFAPKGMTLPAGFDLRTLHPLPREGYYRVAKAFHCCEKQCVHYQPEQLVQLGYNGAGKPLVFMPELIASGLSVPERGTMIDDAALPNLIALQVAERRSGENKDLSLPRGILVH
jgi:hypothetical protein